MSLKKIITIPDPILREKSKDIVHFDNKTKKLMDDMLDTMYAAPGIGLAAIQIGIAKRVVVIDVSKDQEKSPLFLLILKLSGNLKARVLTKRLFIHTKSICVSRETRKM